LDDYGFDEFFLTLLHSSAQLKKLDLQFNFLERLPAEMGEMTHLQTLSLKGNPLKQIPEEAIAKGPSSTVFSNVLNI